MKREIKFRAWDNTKQEMRSVIKMNFHDGDYDVMLLTPTDSAPNHWCLRKLDQIELLQYTGLKDKNGVEIYEGDILEGHHDGNGVVTWSDFDGGYDYRFKDSEVVGLWEVIKNCRVIGNTHQNPELL